MPDGRVEMLPNPNGIADPEVAALLISTNEGTPRAGIFTYACHSRALRAPNRPERWVTGGAFAFLALALGVPGARELFGFATPHPQLLALSAAGALVSLAVANLARHLLAERTATGR